jgi:hypothetical protein
VSFPLLDVEKFDGVFEFFPSSEGNRKLIAVAHQSAFSVIITALDG